MYTRSFGVRMKTNQERILRFQHKFSTFFKSLDVLYCFEDDQMNRWNITFIAIGLGKDLCVI